MSLTRIFLFSNREAIIGEISDTEIINPCWLINEMTDQGLKLNFLPVMMLSDESSVPIEKIREKAIVELVASADLVDSHQKMILQFRAAKAGLTLPQKKKGGMTVNI